MRSHWWWWEWIVSLSLRLSGEKKKSLRITTQQSSFCFSTWYINENMCKSICYHICDILSFVFVSMFASFIFPHFLWKSFSFKGKFPCFISEACGLLSVTLFCSFWGFVCFVLLLLLHPSIHTWPISNSQLLLIYSSFINAISNYILITDFFPKNKFLHLHLVLLPS